MTDSLPHPGTITRLMGLILAVIGAQMLIDGVGGAVTAFQAAREAAM